VERGSALLHTEDPAESTAILSGSDSSGNGNAGRNCDANGNGTGNGNSDNTVNGNSTCSGNDDNTSSGDGNDMDDRGCEISTERLKAAISKLETFIAMMKARPQRPLLPPYHHHHTEAVHVEAPHEEIPGEEAHTKPHDNEPRRSGLRDSKWAPHD
jgi:hypothetical protein